MYTNLNAHTKSMCCMIMLMWSLRTGTTVQWWQKSESSDHLLEKEVFIESAHEGTSWYIFIWVVLA